MSSGTRPSRRNSEAEASVPYYLLFPFARQFDSWADAGERTPSPQTQANIPPQPLAGRGEEAERALRREFLAQCEAPAGYPNDTFHVLVQIYYVRVLNCGMNRIMPPSDFTLGGRVLDQPALRADIFRAMDEYTTANSGAGPVIRNKATHVVAQKLAIAFARLALARMETVCLKLARKINADIGMANCQRLQQDPEAMLQPLRNITRDGQVIEGFPRTAAELDKLDGKTIGRIMLDLDVSSATEHATLRMRRTALRDKWIDEQFRSTMMPNPEGFLFFWGTGHLDLIEAVHRVLLRHP